ncbi:DUF5753 domain-containing protein [Streptomyces sp. NPDC001941]|uniref:DUF5753 domain-containing protein n=1 Tax=Streptomyces sp. NPDC001941 TaxID=3154659 RepID=UPI003321CACA
MTEKPWEELHREGMGPTQEAFLDLVRATTHSRHYCPEVIWGNLQTPDYVRAMLRLVVDFLDTPRDIEAGVAARTARARYIGTGGRTYHVLLGQQALRTNIGGRAVMRAQLDHLLNSFDLEGLRLGIIPDRSERWIYPGNSFSVFDGQRVEVELFGDYPTQTDPGQLASYEKAFSLLARSAVYGVEAEDLVRAESRALG